MMVFVERRFERVRDWMIRKGLFSRYCAFRGFLELIFWGFCFLGLSVLLLQLTGSMRISYVLFVVSAFLFLTGLIVYVVESRGFLADKYLKADKIDELVWDIGSKFKHGQQVKIFSVELRRNKSDEARAKFVSVAKKGDWLEICYELETGSNLTGASSLFKRSFLRDTVSIYVKKREIVVVEPNGKMWFLVPDWNVYSETKN